eukprot:685437-Prymnesium_polylepis.1
MAPPTHSGTRRACARSSRTSRSASATRMRCAPRSLSMSCSPCCQRRGRQRCGRRQAASRPTASGQARRCATKRRLT